MKEAPSIPEYNNLYGIISGNDSMSQLTDCLKNRGWKCRESSWTEVEATIPWADLEIFEEGKEVIIHGAIDNDYFENLSSLISEMGYQYSLEIYNEKKEIIKISTKSS